MLWSRRLINNNYSPPIRIVQHGARHSGPRVSIYSQSILFVHYLDKNCSEKFIDKNNLTHRIEGRIDSGAKVKGSRFMVRNPKNA